RSNTACRRGRTHAGNQLTGGRCKPECSTPLLKFCKRHHGCHSRWSNKESFPNETYLTESIRNFALQDNPKKDILAVLQYILDKTSAKTFYCFHRSYSRTGFRTPHGIHKEVGVSEQQNRVEISTEKETSQFSLGG